MDDPHATVTAPEETAAAKAGRQKDLHHRFLGAAAWVGFSRTVTGIASIGVTFTMARLLEPQDYGLFAMTGVITGFLSMAQSLGVGPALIQREHVTPENEQAAFSLALASSTVLYAVIFLIAYPAALWYGDPRVTPLLQVVGLSFPITAFAVVPGAMLSREMNMRGDAWTSFATMVLESAVMVTVAWFGYGVWAFVAGQLTAVATTAVGLSLYRPWSIGLRLRGGDLRTIVKFGGGTTLSGFLWNGYQNADVFLIGRLLGPSAVGVYQMAWKLAKMPWERLWQAVTPVLLPLYSRAKTDPGELASVLRRLSRFTALVTVPAVAGLGVVAYDVVFLFLGERWIEAAAPLGWLSAYMAVRSVFALLPFILTAVGQVKQEVLFNLGCAVLLPASFAFVLWMGWGIVGVGIVWAFVWPAIAAVWLVPKALAAAQLPLHEYVNSMIRPVASTILMVLVVWAVGLVLPTPSAARLAIRVVTGVLVYLACIRVLEGPLVPEFKSVLAGIRKGVKN